MCRCEPSRFRSSILADVLGRSPTAELIVISHFWELKGVKIQQMGQLLSVRPGFSLNFSPSTGCSNFLLPLSQHLDLAGGEGGATAAPAKLDCILSVFITGAPLTSS